MFLVFTIPWRLIPLVSLSLCFKLMGGICFSVGAIKPLASGTPTAFDLDFLLLFN